MTVHQDNTQAMNNGEERVPADRTTDLSPLYVTGLPLSWRGCNGRYSPVYDRDGQFTNTWECERTSYWGLTLRPLIIRFDEVEKTWVFQTEGFLGLPSVLFTSRRGPPTSHPCTVAWYDGIKVSHDKPWFWQVL